MKITLVLCAALSLFAATGCKKKGGGEMLSKLEGFSKQMCECKDKECAEKVNAEMVKWTTEASKDAAGKADEKPDPEMAKKFGEVTTKYGECMTKLTMPATPPPAAEPPAAPPAAAEPPAAEPPAATPPAAEEKKEPAAAAPEEKKDEKKDEKKGGGW
jgi:hypothetical protein